MMIFAAALEYNRNEESTELFMHLCDLSDTKETKWFPR